METLKIDSLLNEKGLDSGELQKLADTIMKEYCIDNGLYLYYPIEIEFYIYNKDKHPDRHVYPRIDKHSWDLFFHYSGMDICFESTEGCFGGILIRALERMNKKDGSKLLFGGPLVCVNEVLNSADGICEVKPTKTKLDKEAVPFGRRVGIKALKNKEDKYFNKEYRFVREDINEKSTFASRNAYNFDNNTFETKASSYKIEEYIE